MKLPQEAKRFHFVLPWHHSIQHGAAVSLGGRTRRRLLWSWKWSSTFTGWLPMEGFGMGGRSNIPQAFPEKSPGEVQQQQEARPKPTSCTGFLDWQDKNGPRGREAAAQSRMGRLETNVAKPQFLPSHLGASVLLPDHWRGQSQASLGM